MPLFEDPPGHTTTPHTGQSVLDPARDRPISFLVPALTASVGPSAPWHLSRPFYPVSIIYHDADMRWNAMDMALSPPGTTVAVPHSSFSFELAHEN